MQPTTPPSSSKKNGRRRKVADDLQEKHPENVKNLLAALQKAQGKGGNATESHKVYQIKTEPETSRKASRNENKAGPSKQNPSSSRARHDSHHEGNRQRHNSTSVTQSKNTTKQSSKGGGAIPTEVLSDLEFRFITNIPDHEKYDNTRVCFQVELAHWFYVDYFVNKERCGRSDCHNMGMREFARQMFRHCSELSHLSNSIDVVLEEWRYYKSMCPTYGGILMDETLNKVLLVQGYYASKNSWGFPKGKVNEKEPPRNCAVREVYEETGYDFEENPHNEPKIQKFINDTMVRLYVVTDVPVDFPFAPRTRNEIRDIKWFNLWDLPTDKNDQVHRMGPLSNNNFYTVIPFVHDLQNYVRREQQRRAALPKPKQEPQLPQQSSDLTNSLRAIFQPAALGSLFINSSLPESAAALASASIPRVADPVPTATVPPPAVDEPAMTSASDLLSNLFPQPESMTLFPPLKQPTASTSQAAFSQSPFRPVDDMAQTILNIVTPAAKKTSPQIVFPIPARGRPSIDGNEQERPLRQQKISISETSAFKAIPQSKSNTALNAVVAPPMRPLPVTQSIPKESQAPHAAAPQYFQSCEAWKNFRWDGKAFDDFFRTLYLK